MKRKERNVNYNIYFLLVMVFIPFLTVGFSAFEAVTSISGISAKVRVVRDIRITGASITNTSNLGQSSGEEYGVKTFTSSVNLPNSNSTVTYDIDITNIGNVPMGVLDITGLPSNLTYSISNYNLKDKLCDNINTSSCTLGSVTTLHVTILYAQNGYNSGNTNYNVQMEFSFKEAYTISYSGFTSTTGLPTTILDGETKNITFTSQNDIPSAVLVTNATSTYNSPTLVLSNANGNVVVTSSNGNTQVIENPDGTTTTITTIENPNGSTTTTSVTTDGNNHVLEETVTLTNTDGSSTSTTTNYDASGNETGGSTNVTDTNGNSSTQTYSKVNGNDVITGYEITTPAGSNSSQSGLTVVNGTGIDTGVLALDGNPFTIDLVAKYSVNKNGSNSGKVVLAALEPTSNGAKTYKGFAFSIAKNPQVGLYASTSSSISSNANKPGFGSEIASSSSLTTGNVSHTLHVEYTPGTGNNFGTITWTIDGNTYTTTNDSHIPTSLTNATITVGTLGVEHTRDMASMEIVSFNVTKSLS